MIVGIKYCGGCNPRYDRVAAARRLEAAFPGLTFTPARPGAGIDVLLVLCGCTARCADLTGLKADTILYLCAPEDEVWTAAALGGL